MDKRVQNVIGLMKNNLVQDLLPTELAGLVNLSPSRLRHLFKAEVGMSLKAYQRLIRIQKATELIETSFLSIKQIRNKTGLADRGGFAKQFRRIYGVTPTQHRVRSVKTTRIV